MMQTARIVLLCVLSLFGLAHFIAGGFAADKKEYDRAAWHTGVAIMIAVMVTAALSSR